MSQTVKMISLTICYEWKRLVLGYASLYYERDKPLIKASVTGAGVVVGNSLPSNVRCIRLLSCLGSPCFSFPSCAWRLCGIEQGTKKTCLVLLKFEREGLQGCINRPSSLATITVTVLDDFVHPLREV